MWVERGEAAARETQWTVARPSTSTPTVALIENPRTAGWPVTPDAMQSSQGYTLEPNGSPCFSRKFSDVSIRDRIAPSATARRFTRKLDFKGSLRLVGSAGAPRQRPT